jgi:small subunit ribosomal protein S16
VAVKIKLKRIGKIREPHYRIVIADARAKRNGRAIEEIGQYHPLHDPSVIKVDSDRVQYWLGVGAQPTEAVAALLRVTGDWQKFKGEPAPPPMKMAEPKQDKRAVFEAAVKDGAAEPTTAATTPKKAKAPKAAKAEPAKAESEPAGEPAAEKTTTEAAPAVAEAPAEAASEPDAAAQAAPDAGPDEAAADEGKS